MNTRTEAQARFLRDEEGNVTIFSIFMLMLILLFTGAAVDIMRFESVRSTLQSSVDRAVLAAADLDQERLPEEVVADCLSKSELPPSVSRVESTTGANFREVRALGKTRIDTLFIHMSGYDRLAAPAIAKAEERIANVEISLVLDISGSMRWNSRIDRLRPAAKGFIDKVMSEESAGITTLNLIPYAGSVNPGGIMFDYFRGERPKLNENNGWGNGDQDAPGNSLCNNNAENADEGAADPSCAGEVGATATGAGGYFTPWVDPITDMVFYFDTDANGAYDDRTDIAHKISDFPADAPRDGDDIYKGAVAFLMDADTRLTSPDQFLGASIRGGSDGRKYFQVKGDQNGAESDLGPTKNTGKIPGNTYPYSSIDFSAWEGSYVAPQGTVETDDAGAEQPAQKVNMPSSCVEIYDDEFSTTKLPISNDYIPHFQFWPIDTQTMDWGWCPEDDTAIQYYSDNAEALKTFVDNMRLHDGTGTQYGMKYALAMLSPEIRPEVSYMIGEGLVNGRFAGRPMDWNDAETEKYIVLMTDGEVTEQYRPKKPKAPANGEIDLQTQGSSTYTKAWTKSEDVDLMLEQCTLAKSLGVTIFTVAFEASSTAQQQMKDCASSPSHFFAVNGTEISDAFTVIARQINNLRLVQ